MFVDRSLLFVCLYDVIYFTLISLSHFTKRQIARTGKISSIMSSPECLCHLQWRNMPNSEHSYSDHVDRLIDTHWNSNLRAYAVALEKGIFKPLDHRELATYGEIRARANVEL